MRLEGVVMGGQRRGPVCGEWRAAKGAAWGESESGEAATRTGENGVESNSDRREDLAMQQRISVTVQALCIFNRDLTVEISGIFLKVLVVRRFKCKFLSTFISTSKDL
jgi:hypothetical protein